MLCEPLIVTVSSKRLLINGGNLKEIKLMFQHYCCSNLVNVIILSQGDFKVCVHTFSGLLPMSVMFTFAANLSKHILQYCSRNLLGTNTIKICMLKTQIEEMQ